MKKILRSFLHEQLPLDLRVEIELLSRRRDIFNAEKQEELIKLLRKFNIQGIVPLGSGTNRYAFKLNGFVIKVATDNDGKIDNFKEFKMAKRLYPYVAKTYEVSDNGTLLVAEYIEPFQSYGEMISYADQIRDILKKLSSVYLIGDVGITKKNYANWGKRIGSDEPVCLDFAYVYDVKSELFLCKACKNNSMLIPNNDFTKLICPAVGCGKEYEFEEIRARLGNDIHSHEIGDLSKEGYLMYENNQETELDYERSNYLHKPIEPEAIEEGDEEEIIPDDFVCNINNSIQEETNMNAKVFGKRIVNVMAASVEVADAEDVNDNIPVVEAVSVAFSGDINSYDENETDVEAIIESMASTDEEETSNDVDVEVINMPETNETEEDAEDNVLVAEVVNEEQNDSEEPQNEQGKVTYEEFSNYFKKNAYQAPLEFGRKVSDGYLYKKLQIFDKVRNSIVVKKGETLYPERFYNSMAYIINHAILDFCKFDVVEGTNKRGKVCKNYIISDDILDKDFTPTLYFLARFYNHNNLRYINDVSDLMDEYKKEFTDCIGLQNEIIDVLSEKIHESFNISDQSVNDIIDALIDGGFIISKASKFVDPLNTYTGEDSEEESTDEQPDEVESYSCDDESDNDNNEDVGLAFSGSIDNDEDVENPSVDAEYSEYDGYDEVDNENENDEYEVTGVYVYPEEDISVINVVSPGAFGTLQIPIYINLNGINSELSDVYTYDGNKEWDWLTHLNADNIFRTNNPEKYLGLNDITCYEDSIVRFAVLDETEAGDFIMGMWLIGQIVEVDEEFEYHTIWDDKDKMIKLNNAIVDNIGNTCVSHLKMTLSNPNLVRSEEEFNDMYSELFEMLFEDAENDADYEDRGEELAEELDEEEQNETNENEQAALDALFGSDTSMTTFKPIHRINK